MVDAARSCPNCGAGLKDTRGKAIVKCDYCGTEVPIHLTATESIERTLKKREDVEPLMEALMTRYAARLSTGDAQGALPFMEAVHYLTLWMAYEVEELEALEGMVRPLIQGAASELDVRWTPGVPMTWDRVQSMAKAALVEPS